MMGRNFQKFFLTIGISALLFFSACQPVADLSPTPPATASGTITPSAVPYAPSPEPTAPSPTPTPQKAYALNADTPVYSLADTASPILFHLAFAQEVFYMPHDDTFAKVICPDGETGYLPKDALSTQAPTPTPLPSLVPGQKLQHPQIRIYKAERRLELYDGDTLAAVYPIALGWEPIGHKEMEGDGRTPEGEYYICTRNPNSSYYLSLGLSYPNERDAHAALTEGRIDEETYNAIASAIQSGQRPPWNTPLGGAIMIHGCGSAYDWTAGCVAVEDIHMDILWENCPVGTRVHIFP